MLTAKETREAVTGVAETYNVLPETADRIDKAIQWAIEHKLYTIDVVLPPEQPHKPLLTLMEHGGYKASILFDLWNKGYYLRLGWWTSASEGQPSGTFKSYT